MRETLTLRSLSGRAVAVPMKRPLGTSVETIKVASLLLIDLATEEGITGRAYAFCYRPSIARAGEVLIEDLGAALERAPVVPLELSRRLRSLFKLPGLAGPLTMIASAIDMAAWDAVALSMDLPLATLLGSAPKPIAAYNSNGLGLVAPEAAADEAEQLLAEGFKAVKLRVGRQDPAADLAVVRAVRKRIPAEALLMLDFNQALSFAAAMQRCRALDDEGAYWIEEPIRHDDYAHCALVADVRSDAHSDRGEPFQLGPGRGGAVGDGFGLPHAGCRSRRRRQRMAQRGWRRGGQRSRGFVASLPGSQCASTRCYANGSLARICRLGRTDLAAALAGRRRPYKPAFRARHRALLGRGRHLEVSAEPLT